MGIHASSLLHFLHVTRVALIGVGQECLLALLRPATIPSASLKSYDPHFGQGSVPGVNRFVRGFFLLRDFFRFGLAYGAGPYLALLLARFHSSRGMVHLSARQNRLSLCGTPTQPRDRRFCIDNIAWYWVGLSCPHSTPFQHLTSRGIT